MLNQNIQKDKYQLELEQIRTLATETMKSRF